MSGRRVVASPGVLVRQLEDESVLLDLQSESYFGLDSVGTCMWAALVSAPRFEDAYSELLEEYEVEPATLRKDLEGFVASLAQAGLVQVVDA